METEIDVREVTRGTQVTFELRSHTVVGTVGDYMGEGQYVVVDEDDTEHEVNVSQFEITE